MVVVAVGLVTGMTACGNATDTAEQKLLATLSATELFSRRLEYAVDTGDEHVGVAVTIEDDYRYSSVLSIDDRVAYREVVYDDALASQLVDPGAVTMLGESPEAKTPLTAGGWMVDELGAPPAVLPAKQIGADPIVDTLAYFSYVREAAQASEVTKFDNSALEYRPDEDPFPQPASGELRYDILPTRLPDRAAIERAGGADVPELSDVRKLAVYVRDGQVVEVREAIDVEPFASTLRRSFNAHGANDRELLARINKLRRSIGQRPIVPRTTTMAVELSGGGLRVKLPAGTPTTLLLHVGDAATAPQA